jgi:Flp pilus assembly protein TadD
MAQAHKKLIRQRPPPKAAPTATGRDQRWRTPGLCLVLVAITVAVFGQTLRHEFVDFDDYEYVLGNPMVRQGLTFKGTVWAFTGFHTYNWHPLTWLSHMLDCQLYGLNPAGHHLTNILLHTATVVALFLVLRQMTGAFWRSAFVAAVFAIHPLRVESVAWVAERKDVLSGLFFMLTIGAYVRYARLPWSLARYGLVVLLFAFGLMCKPMLVTLPVVLLLLDYWPLTRWRTDVGGKPALCLADRIVPRRVVFEKLPLLALSAAGCVVTLLAQNKAIQSTGLYSMPLRFANALVVCMVYLGQMVWPAGLAVLYPFPHNGPPMWEVALAATLLAGLSVAAWGKRRTRPWLLIGWLWYLVMLLPVVGLVQVGPQPHADRYTYLPQIGIYVAVTWLVAEWRVSRAVLGSLMAGVLAVLMVCARKQAAYWQNSETLWTHTLGCTADNYVAHTNLGTILYKEGRVDEAITQYQMALKTIPDNASAHHNPIKALLESLHFNLARALLQKGRAEEAIAQYQMALQIEPADVEVQNDLAWLLATCPQASLRNGDKAMQLARQANEMAHGKNPVILGTLAAAFAEAGRLSEAVETAQLALHLAEEQSNTDVAGQLQFEMKFYQAGSSFHISEPPH